MRRSIARHALRASALVVGTVHVVGSIHSGDLPGNGDSWALGLTGMGEAALGWTIVGRRPQLRIGWLMLCGGLVGTTTYLASWWAQDTLVTQSGSLPFGPFAAWWATWSAPLPIALVVVVPLVLFPAGIARSRRWRAFLVAVTVVLTGLVIGSAVLAALVAARTPSQLVEVSGGARGQPADFAVGLSAIGWLLSFVAAGVAFVGIVLARRRERGDARRQYTTVLIGVAVMLASIVAPTLLGPLTGRRHEAPEAVGAIFWLAIPTSVAVAIIRYRLYDLRVLISRSILVVGVGSVLAGAYFAVLVIVARIIGSSTSVSTASLVAAAAVGILSVFAATGITTSARRWFGRTTEAHVVAARFNDSQQPSDDPRLSLHRLATTVRDELRLGSVELLFDGVETIRVGEHDGPTTSVTLHRVGRHSGELVVTARRGESLSRRDRELLDQIGRYVALAAEAIRTNDELLAAQHSLENAHADERRRLRMDLHDGLGPTLAAVRLKLVAHGRTAADPAPVTEVAEQVSDAIREVRRIVDGLQPSILEDLGLVPAIQIMIADVRRTSGIDFTVDAPSDLPQIPSVIATTAYRAVAEGIANVARHSRATVCRVHIALREGCLDVTVEDDGCGFDTTIQGGMGLRSIRARALDVGGTAKVESRAGRGTTIAARLPLGAST